MSESALPFSRTKTAAPEAMLPILATSTVPLAAMRKRRRVTGSPLASVTTLPLASVSVRLPTSSETPPRIDSSGLVRPVAGSVSSKRPAARSSMPPEISMKKTLSGVWAGFAGAWRRSISLNACASAWPVLPAVSLKAPVHETTTAPATKVPVR